MTAKKAGRPKSSKRRPSKNTVENRINKLELRQQLDDNFDATTRDEIDTTNKRIDTHNNVLIGLLMVILFLSVSGGLYLAHFVPHYDCTPTIKTDTHTINACKSKCYIGGSCICDPMIIGGGTCYIFKKDVKIKSIVCESSITYEIERHTIQTDIYFTNPTLTQKHV